MYSHVKIIVQVTVLATFTVFLRLLPTYRIFVERCKFGEIFDRKFSIRKRDRNCRTNLYDKYNSMSTIWDNSEVSD